MITIIIIADVVIDVDVVAMILYVDVEKYKKTPSYRGAYVGLKGGPNRPTNYYGQHVKPYT